MSVILGLTAITATQGWNGTEMHGYVTNSGNENATYVSLKVIDAVVFDKLVAYKWSTGTVNCLNVFGGYLKTTMGGGHHIFPAGSTQEITFSYIWIKAAAPVQVHNITCDFQYTVY